MACRGTAKRQSRRRLYETRTHGAVMDGMLPGIDNMSPVKPDPPPPPGPCDVTYSFHMQLIILVDHLNFWCVDEIDRRVDYWRSHSRLYNTFMT